jgi:hypothetical protein
MHRQRRFDPDRAGALAAARTPTNITTQDALRLKIEPMADCGRHDSIRKVA